MLFNATLYGWRLGCDKQEGLFFWAAKALQKLLLAVPLRMAALCVVAATLFIPRTSFGRALKVACSLQHDSPAAYMQKLVAEALKISLAGPHPMLSGQLYSYDWQGEGSAQLHKTDLARGVLLLLLASFLWWFVLLLGYACMSLYN